MTIDFDVEAYEALKNVPRVGNSVEIDLFMLLAPILMIDEAKAALMSMMSRGFDLE